MKATKIVATIGPASKDPKILAQLIDAGVDVARLNFSHGDHEDFANMIQNIRAHKDETAILLDTKGPEIRTGEERHELTTGEEVTLTKTPTPGAIEIGYEHLEQVQPNDLILIDDGLIEITITKNDNGTLTGTVNNDGVLEGRKTVTIRGHSVNIPFLCDKDKADIRFGIEHDVDFIAASFVRSANDIHELKTFLDENGGETIHVIAKIEHPDAVKNIDEIIEAAHGVMIARGDLGVELSLEKVPTVQTTIIQKCNRLGRPVIVATQMLESMKTQPRPTRAEVADVAQAIREGTDAIMLSGETATGKYPLKAVQVMTRIAREHDKHVQKPNLPTQHARRETSMFVTRAAALAAAELKTCAIVTPTESGYTARKVSRFKPHCPIMAFSHHKKTVRQLALSWGVIPFYTGHRHEHMEEMRQKAVQIGMANKLFTEDDRIVITAGHRIEQAGGTNIMEIYLVKSILERIDE